MLDLLLGCRATASSYLALKVYSLFNNEVTVNAFIHRYFDIACIGMFRIRIKTFFSKPIVFFPSAATSLLKTGDAVFPFFQTQSCPTQFTSWINLLQY